MDTLLQDIRYGVRILLKNPGFTLVAVLTLGLGVGANTAIFSIVNTVLLHPLPYRDADRLAKVVTSNRGLGTRDIGLSVPEWDDLNQRADVFEDVSVTWPASANLTGAQHPERLEMLGVSPNYFSMLGAKAELGRLFGPQDKAEGFAEAVVISDSLWQRAFGRDPSVLGRRLQLDSDPYTVVGVVEPGFRHPGRTLAGDVEVWATAGFHGNPFPTPARGLRLLPGAIGRLKDGETWKQAQEKLDNFSTRLRADYPNDYPARSQWSIELEPLKESLVGKVRPMLLVLLGAVILIILIASVNIANLLLARASSRQREMAVRQALGASRMRMIRQMLTESIILSLLAGGAGVFTAMFALNSLIRFVPAKVPRLTEVHIDWMMLLFALLVSLLTGLIFGLAPAFQSARADVIEAVREGTHGSGYSAKTSRMRSTLIISEVALAVMLMVGAGLLLRTFWGLLQEDPGFNPVHVMAANIWIPVPNDPTTDPYSKPGVITTFAQEMLRRVSVLPGIEQAAVTTDLPVTDSSFNATLTIEDHPIDSAQDLSCRRSSVSSDYFKVMQGVLISGRFFTDADTVGKDAVAIIDETFAHRFWPNQDPLGKRIRYGRNPNAQWQTIVGVVNNIKTDGLDAKKVVPHVYSAFYQVPNLRDMKVVVRTSLPASALEPQIRRAIQSVDPSLPVFQVQAMTEIIGTTLAPRRFSAELVGVFAVVALLLSSVGIYGLLAYMVGQRSHEIGIRMALGAQPFHIRKLVLSQGVVLAGIGVLVGIVFAGISAPLISSLLYGVHPIDPLVFLSVPAVLVVVALVASYVPAMRASKVDPLVTLRQ